MDDFTQNIKQKSLGAGIRILVSLIKFYQGTAGLILPNTCRFYPTCSNYAIEALIRFGIIKGSLMGLFRIIRCNPLSSGGYDPVVYSDEEIIDGK